MHRRPRARLPQTAGLCPILLLVHVLEECVRVVKRLVARVARKRGLALRRMRVKGRVRRQENVPVVGQPRVRRHRDAHVAEWAQLAVVVAVVRADFL
jgi:hypothetical protein